MIMISFLLRKSLGRTNNNSRFSPIHNERSFRGFARGFWRFCLKILKTWSLRVRGLDRLPHLSSMTLMEQFEKPVFLNFQMVCGIRKSARRRSYPPYDLPAWCTFLAFTFFLSAQNILRTPQADKQRLKRSIKQGKLNRCVLK